MSQELIASHNLQATHEILATLTGAKNSLETILDNQTDIFCLFAEGGRIIKGNGALSQLLNAPADRLYRSSLASLFSGESWKLFANKLEILRKHTYKMNLSFELTVDGEGMKGRESLDYLWTVSRFEAVSVRRGQVYTVVGRDVTEIKKFQKRLGMIFGSVPLAIFQLNRSKQLVQPYSSYTEILFGRDDLAQHKWNDLLESMVREKSASQSFSIMQLIESIGEDEFWYEIYKAHFPRTLNLLINGRNVWVAFNYSPVIRDGVVEEILVVAEDITERMAAKKMQETTEKLETIYASVFLEARRMEAQTASLIVYDIDQQMEQLNRLTLANFQERSSILNPLHTIKGTARSSGLSYFTSLVHELENELLAEHHASQPLSEIFEVYKQREIRIVETWDLVKDVLMIVHKLTQNSEGPRHLQDIQHRVRNVINNTARSAGKDVGLEFHCDSLEVTPEIFSRISEVIVHLVTNAVDHGVEDPDSRAALQKNSRARIRVTIRSQGEGLSCSIEDDGRGIDGEVVAAKAVEKGFITADRARSLSAKDKQRLIFLAGLSTRDKANEISGRGVGMDAADAAVRGISLDGAGIQVESLLGRGTSFHFTSRLAG